MQTYPLRYIFPATAVLTLLAVLRQWRASLDDRLLLICIAFAVAGFLGCFPRPDIPHIGFAVPLALPLLAWSLQRLTGHWRMPVRLLAAAGLCALTVRSFMVFLIISVAVRHEPVTPTPRGDIVTTGDKGLAPLLAEIARAPSSDRFFFYPFVPMLPFLSGRPQVSRYDVFAPGYTTVQQFQETCLDVLRDATWVVTDSRWTDPQSLRVMFPAMQDAAPPEFSRFNQALDSNFALVFRFGTFDLRRRRDDADPAACAGIAG